MYYITWHWLGFILWVVKLVFVTSLTFCFLSIKFWVGLTKDPGSATEDKQSKSKQAAAAALTNNNNGKEVIRIFVSTG
jgi:hypothetical protein